MRINENKRDGDGGGEEPLRSMWELHFSVQWKDSKRKKILPQISEWIKKYFNRRVWDENTSPLFESHCERRVEVGSNSPSRPWRRRRRWMDGWWMDGRTERAAVMRRWLGAGCIRADGVQDGCGDFTLRWQLTVAERAVSSLDTGGMISWLKSWRDLIGLANTLGVRSQLTEEETAGWRGGDSLINTETVALISIKHNFTK